MLIRISGDIARTSVAYAGAEDSGWGLMYENGKGE